jgi:Na+-driven multidrug efflux pump
MTSAGQHSRGIVGLAVPMMGASLAIGVAQVVILGLLGHLGHDALYVRAAYTPIVFAFLALSEAFAASTQVATALSHGRGQRSEGLATAAWLLAFCLLAGGAMAGACWVLAPELAQFVHAPPLAKAGLRDFMRWMPPATVLAMVPLVAAATLRGFGRAGAAAAVTVTYVIVDVAAVAVVAFAAHGGVLSVAWGNAIAAVAASLLALALLVASAPRRGLPRDRPRAVALPLSRQMTPALALLRDVGLPIVCSYAALFAFGLLVIGVLRRFGPDVVTGFSIGYSVQTLAIVPAIALGSASAIFTNHLRGAARDDEAPRAFAATLGLGTRIYVVVASLVTALAFVAPPLISANAAVAQASRGYLVVCGPALLALGIVLVILTVLEQTGAGRLAVALNVANVALVGLVGGALARHFHTPFALYGTIAGATVLGLPVVVAVGRRHVARLADGPTRVGARLEPITHANRADVHRLFCSRDFLFKTQLPWLASADEIDALLGVDARAIVADGRLLGLVELEPASAEAGHYRIHYRLRSDLAVGTWSTVLESIAATLRDERDVLRLTYLVEDSDQPGLALAQRSALDYEGSLPSTVQRRGQRCATRFYARTYEPVARAPRADLVSQGAIA